MKRFEYVRRQAVIGALVALTVSLAMGRGWLEVACWTAFAAIYAPILGRGIRYSRMKPEPVHGAHVARAEHKAAA